MFITAALLANALAPQGTEISAAPASDILHYVRSNRDGSEPEHVVQFRPTGTAVAVYKWVRKCTTAAYVTAEMDDSVREGRRFVAGKVAPDGTQAQFGTLAVEADALVVDVTPPGGPRIQQRHALKSRPFLLYDFDFADLNAFLQNTQPRSDFAYGLPVVWPGERGLFREYGRLRATYAEQVQHLGRGTARFDLSVDGPEPATGTLWVDAEHGFIVEVELGLPNHPEYRDFRLKLIKVENGSEAAWATLLKAHYADCPTGN